jgi:hypothetical protein
MHNHLVEPGVEGRKVTSHPLSEFDEASVSVLNIGGKTTECQHCRAMIWPDEAFPGTHRPLLC